MQNDLTEESFDISYEWLGFDMTLQHSGVKGMRWGDRRYQNLDGSLTPAGRLRYLKSNRSVLKGDSGSTAVSSGGNRSLLKNSSASPSAASNSNEYLSVVKNSGTSPAPPRNSNGYLSVVKNPGSSFTSNSGGLRSVVKQVASIPDNFSVMKLSSPENMKRSKVGHNAVRSMGLI